MSGTRGERLARAFLLGVLASLPVLGVRLYSSQQLGQGTVVAYTTTYTGAYVDSPLTTTVVVGDGQAFAALARDPLLRRPEVFYTDGLAAYRAQRPLLGYVVWVLSAGQPRWVEPALLLMAMAGAGLVALAAGLLLEGRGVDGRLGALLVLTPGVVASTTALVPEPLGLALAMLGLWAYWRGRLGPGAVLLLLAVLTRETMLLVPAVLAVAAWRARRWDRVAALAAVFAGWAAWIGVVRARYHAWPWDVGSDRFTPPFLGFVRALPGMRWPVVTLGCAVVAALLAVVAARRLGRDRLAPLVVAFAAFGAFLSEAIWHRWDGFGRILVPVYVLGGVVALTARWGARSGQIGAGGTDAGPSVPEAEPADEVAHQ